LREEVSGTTVEHCPKKPDEEPRKSTQPSHFGKEEGMETSKTTNKTREGKKGKKVSKQGDCWVWLNRI